jgi:NAD(P)-dependent dehydrogenase (short-subunit alcohol dehydrogenase family)
MLLNKRVALVTGAASARGIGRATARLFAAEGARVAVLDRDGVGAGETAALLPGNEHLSFGVDITDRVAVGAAVAAVLARHGRIDVLVNNAGVVAPERLMEVDDALFARLIDINLRGVMVLTQAVVPAMRAAGRGSIVNLSSVAGQRGGGIFGGTPYAAAKAGVLGYTKAAARELAPDGIRVNAVAPSMVDTDMALAGMSEAQKAAVVAGIPMGRLATADEVAGCCLFLASDLAGYVTGATLDVNGGSHMH